MKLNIILSSLVVAAIKNDNVVYCMEDMDNTTDTNTTTTTNGEDGWWGQLKANTKCFGDILKLYADNQALSDAQSAWEASGIRESTKGGGDVSYSWSYSADTLATFEDECKKVEGTTWTQPPAKTYNCSWGAFGGDDVVEVATSNNALCLPDSEQCNLVTTTSDKVANDEMYEDIKNNGIYCDVMISSGNEVTSTKFLGSLVAATAFVAFTVLN